MLNSNGNELMSIIHSASEDIKVYFQDITFNTGILSYLWQILLKSSTLTAVKKKEWLLSVIIFSDHWKDVEQLACNSESSPKIYP